MKRLLAVFTPDDLAACEATFIRRHMHQLLPGGTVVMARSNGSQPSQPDVPLLNLSHIVGGRLRWQVAHAVARQFGAKLDKVAVRRFLEKHRVEVVLGEYLDFSVQWLDVCRESGIHFFAHAHGVDVSARLRDERWRREYLQYNRSGGIITMNQPSREILIGLGLLPEKIHLIPYGVDVPPEPVAREDRAGVRCIAVGRVVPQKAPILLLDAFRRAAAECPALQLDYIGAGPLMPAVQEFICAFRLQGRITLHGRQPNDVVLAMLRNADIFLQHSMTDPETGNEEGLPVAILEAMAQGLPVVSTRHAGIPEAVVDGSTGYLTDPGDSDAMAARIIELTRDPGLRRRLGTAGWQRAKDLFTWERERAALLRVLGLEKQ